MEEARIEGEKKVMIAVDESDCSQFALEWALSNLKDNLTNSSGLILFTAIPLDYSPVVAGSYGTAAPVDVVPELITSIQENQKKSAIAILNKAKHLCTSHGSLSQLNVEALYKFGNPKEAICKVVDKNHVQLLIVGSHGKGLIQRALLGSVSSYCVHHAKCPVLVVRKPPA